MSPAAAIDLSALLQRHGRALLVPGVSAPAQAAMAAVCVAVTVEGDEAVVTAAEATLHALVGAGVGRVCALGEQLAPLVAAERIGQALDSGLRWSVVAADATPPLVHLHLASRPYGASADALITAHAAGWDLGLGRDAVVGTVLYETGAPLQAADAVVLGHLLAWLLVEHLLGLAPLPAIAHLRAPPGEAPTLTLRRPDEVGADVHPQGGEGAEPVLLEALRTTPAVREAIVGHCERDWPLEACGLVVRRPDGALAAVPSRNLQDRYHAMDPEAFPRTSRSAFLLDARLLQRHLEAGDALVAIYHSHCEAGAYFSAEDARAAAPDGEPIHPNARHLVVAVLGGKASAAAAFAFDAGLRAFVPERGGGPGAIGRR